MKISDNTSISMPMRNLIGLIAAIGIGIFAYSDLTQRLTQLETARQLMEADLLKKAEQTPVDMEQSMILEWLGTKNATMEAELESMMHNKVNIEFLKEQVTQMQKDVELKTQEARATEAKYEIVKRRTMVELPKTHARIEKVLNSCFEDMTLLMQELSKVQVAEFESIMPGSTDAQRDK